MHVIIFDFNTEVLMNSSISEWWHWGKKERMWYLAEAEMCFTTSAILEQRWISQIWPILQMYAIVYIKIYITKNAPTMAPLCTQPWNVNVWFGIFFPLTETKTSPSQCHSVWSLMWNLGSWDGSGVERHVINTSVGLCCVHWGRSQRARSLWHICSLVICIS